MKKIVIQRHGFNLDGIARCVAELGGETDVFYTSDPQEILREVRGDIPVLVVSGQVFDYRISGTALAREVKRINPNALFFIYSVMPEWNEAVDGIIPKFDGTVMSRKHLLLAQILVSDLTDITARGLHEKFPEVKIH